MTMFSDTARALRLNNHLGRQATPLFQPQVVTKCRPVATILANRNLGAAMEPAAKGTLHQTVRPGPLVRSATPPRDWVLNPPTGVRLAWFLKEANREFDVHEFELDWTGVVCDADYRLCDSSWVRQSFEDSRWQSTCDATRRLHLRSANCLILMRALQGVVAVKPECVAGDWKRPARFYDGTVAFLQRCGLLVLS
jgi:hypothetical protein